MATQEDMLNVDEKVPVKLRGKYMKYFVILFVTITLISKDVFFHFTYCKECFVDLQEAFDAIICH